MVSVCMATYNGEKYLKRQLDTILEQLNPEDELVISDDSSTDHTIELIKEYDDGRITLIEKANFGSPVFNMENALKKAKGDYIFLADQDDVWLPGRVTKTLEQLQHYNLVVCNAFIVDENEKIINESYFDWKGSKTGFWKNLKKNSYIGCAMALDRKILNAALPFPSNLIMHDIWIGLLAERLGKVKFFNDRLIYYRRHVSNFTAAAQRDDKHLSDFSTSFKIRYRKILLEQLAKRIWTIKYLKHRQN